MASDTTFSTVEVVQEENITTR